MELRQNSQNDLFLSLKGINGVFLNGLSPGEGRHPYIQGCPVRQRSSGRKVSFAFLRETAQAVAPIPTRAPYLAFKSARTASRMSMTSTLSKIAGTTQTLSTSRFGRSKANATSFGTTGETASGPCKAALMARSFWRDLELSSFQSSPQPSVQQNQRSPGASDAATMNPKYRSTSSSRMCSENMERSTSSSARRDVVRTAERSYPRRRWSSRRVGLRLRRR